MPPGKRPVGGRWVYAVKIDIRYHVIREVVYGGNVMLKYCPTEQMIADVLTKPVTKLKLKSFARDMFSTY